MALHKEIKYSYNDIGIVPAIVSQIEHRGDCDPFINGKLPLFTAPMSSVVDENNFQIFEENGINSILPRTVDFNTRVSYAVNGKWAAFGLKEFEETFIVKDVKSYKIKVLIDIANGHMAKLLSLVRTFKEKYKDIQTEIMVGNIANPFTYIELAKVGVDYVRCGIGVGEGCFIAGTEILTENGLKKIENVVIGEKVLTYKKNWKEVKNTISYKNRSKKILKINKEISCTNNHKFFVVNKSDKDKITEKNITDYGYWVEAEKLDKDKHFLVKLV